MDNLSQSTLQQWYVQQTKPHLYLTTVQSITKEDAYTFNPPYSTYTPYTQYVRITYYFCGFLCTSCAIVIQYKLLPGTRVAALLT